MVQAVIGIHVTVCITLVILILLQQGKGADVGAVFGGSSNTVFGASGAGNVLSRATSALAVLFFATSLYLAYMSSQRASGSIFGSGSSSVMSQHLPKVPLVPNAPAGSNAPGSNPLVPNAEPNTGAAPAPAAPSTNK